MKNSPGTGALLAAAVALSACATSGEFSPMDLPARELAGHFTVGTDASWFRPCAPAPGDSLWWATFVGPAVAERDSLVAAGRIRSGSPVFLRISAATSEPRAAGADGRGSRFVYVRRVLEARAAQATDCAPPGGGE